MSIEQQDVIDFIGVDKVKDTVNLTIADQLEWGNNEHLLMLQNKLNSYLSFVESGELIVKYPDAANRQVVIQLESKYTIDESGKQFLHNVAKVIKNIGIIFEY